MQEENLKKLARRFQVGIHFNLGYAQPKTHKNVFCVLNRKKLWLLIFICHLAGGKQVSFAFQVITIVHSMTLYPFNPFSPESAKWHL